MAFEYNKNNRVALLRELLGIKDEASDNMLAFTLQFVESRVLSYINDDHIPEKLETTLLAIAAAYYKAAQPGTDAVGTGAITSVKRGDVQTTFADASGAAFNLTDGGDFFGWRSVLNEYRKLRW